MANLDAVIFDIHGTLLDSNDAKAYAWRKTFEEYGKTMPQPDIGGLDPARVIVVGDTPYDVTAAKKAGLRTVAVLYGGFSRESLDGAVAIYQSPSEMLLRYHETPFAKEE